MKITAAGDIILMQPLADEGYEGIEGVREFIGRGDARIGNLEMCVTDNDTYGSTVSGGTWVNARPAALDSVLSYGFNFLGFSNNHSFDMGPEGFKETLAFAKERGITLAGAGENLAAAAHPVFNTFRSGRVALIAASLSFSEESRAGDANREVKGRPGLNAIRTKITLEVTPEHFQAIQEIYDNTGYDGWRIQDIKDGFIPPLPEGTLPMSKYWITKTDGEERKVVTCNKADLERMRKSIEAAKLVADYVVVMIHAHAMKKTDDTEPADSIIELAHFCADAGACAVIGSGAHRLRPIELYKSVPIFYSLADFAFQSNMVEHQPADAFYNAGIDDHEMSIKELALKTKGWSIGHHTQAFNFKSIIPYMEFDGDKLTELTLCPIELGFDKPRTFKGVPYVANATQAEDIYNELVRVSKSYGTKMTLGADGLIRVEL